MSDSYESLGERSSLSQQMIAGTSAGIVEHSMSYPFDNLKTRLQCNFKRGSKLSNSKILSQTVKFEGIRGLYKGISAVLCGAGPAHAFYFGLYEYSKLKMEENSFNSTLTYTLSGALATVAHDLIMVPTDTIKQRCQLRDCPFKNVKSCVSCLVKEEGFLSLYRSFKVQLGMNIPFHSTNFLIYETTSNYFNPGREYNPKIHCLSGALAGAFAAFITNPLDVCKTLLNTQKYESTNLPINTSSEAVRTIYSSNGLRGFFTGSTLRILHAAPGTMACWSVYEMFKHILI